MEAYEERSSSLVERLVNVLSLGTPEHPYLPPSERPVYDRDLFVLESRIIKSIVDDHDAVIIGRGASYVLRDRPEAVHVFIHAPIAFRAERLMKAKKIKSLAEARAAVEESDRGGPGSSRTWWGPSGRTQGTTTWLSIPASSA